MNTKSIFLSAVCLFGIIAANGQPRPPYHKYRQPQDESQRWEFICQRLSLTDEQQEKIKQIDLQFEKEQKALEEQMKKNREKKAEQIRKVLTPEQQAECDLMQRQRQETSQRYRQSPTPPAPCRCPCYPYGSFRGRR